MEYKNIENNNEINNRETKINNVRGNKTFRLVIIILLLAVAAYMLYSIM